MNRLLSDKWLLQNAQAAQNLSKNGRRRATVFYEKLSLLLKLRTFVLVCSWRNMTENYKNTLHPYMI